MTTKLIRISLELDEYLKSKAKPFEPKGEVIKRLLKI